MHVSRFGQVAFVTVWLVVALWMAGGSPLNGQGSEGTTTVFLPLLQGNISGTTDPSPHDYVGVAYHGDLGDSDTNEIYTVRGDGSDIRQLTTNAVRDEKPDLSPDGTRIAYQRHYLEPEIRDYILVSDVNGGNETPFDAGGFRSLIGYQWQPNGGNLLAFGARGISTGIEDLLLFAPDGSVEVLYAHFSKSSLSWGWSPDGQYIYLTSYEDQEFEVWVTTADGSSAWRHAGAFLAWHPTRQALLIQSTNDTDTPTLELVAPVGGESERLYTGPYQFREWLRHGQALLLNDTDGDGTTYIYELDGTLTALPDDGQRSHAWGISPDGNAIFYSTSAKIYYHTLHNNRTIVLEDNCPTLCSSGTPSWAQDGSGLVYVNGDFLPDPPRTFTEGFYVNLQSDTPTPVSLFYRSQHWNIAYLPGSSRWAIAEGNNYGAVEAGVYLTEPATNITTPFPLFWSGDSIQEWRYQPQ